MRQLTLKGAFSSPYSLKMRAVLRYRRIPYRWVLQGSQWDDLPPAPVPVVPVLGFHDADGAVAEVMVDSSPQIARLEQEYNGRSLVSTDPASAFLDFLLEDYADEWVTKAMYHYRWTYGPDIDKAGRLLPLDRDLHLGDEQLQGAHDFIIDRQVGRRGLVGSTETNLPIIEGSYERLLDLLQAHLADRHFLFGERPARTDFALSGQLTPMTWWDPTPMAVAVERAPRLVNWIQRVDDLSWWEVDGDEGWDPASALPEAVHAMLREAGSTYAPFMLANAAALEAGAEEVVCEILGSEYRQAPFKYQGKCLTWLREAHAALDDTARTTVDGILDGTGCEQLFRVMPDVDLYGHWTCPFVHRVAWALAERGIDHGHVDVPPSPVRPKDFVLPEAFIAHSPRLEIPMARVGDEHLADSIPVLEWLEVVVPDAPPLLPRDDEGAALVRERMRRIDADVFAPMIGVYYGVDDERIARSSTALSRALEEVSGWLDDGPWLAGPVPTLADAVFVPFLVREGALRPLGFVDPVPDPIAQYARRVRTGRGWPAVEWTPEQADEVVSRFLARRRKARTSSGASAEATSR